MAIYEKYEVRTDRVEIKFSTVLNVSSFANSHFVLRNISLATPAVIVNPFDDINLTRDYYSISRTLFLYWNTTLPSDSNFTLTISGMKTVLGIQLPTEVISFSTGAATTDPITEDIPTRLPVDVEDYSIKAIVTSGVFPDYIETTTTPFHLLSIKPSSDEAWFLDSSYNEGRIEITFSAPLAANFISNDFFKMQKKKLGQGIARWETVTTIVTSNSNLVIIYMPSNDDTPIFGEPAYIYWEVGYKYRLRISGSIGPATMDDIGIFDAE